jgi:glutamate-1-semialdehyde 2,1-aminomutase
MNSAFRVVILTQFFLVSLGFANLPSSPRFLNLNQRQAHVTTESNRIFTEAKQIMPGGVSSPVRAFNGVDGDPIVFDHVKGAYCWDVDQNKYIDYVGSWGPAIIGHADDEVLDVLHQQLEKGTSFGAPSELENVLAQAVIDAVPSVEMVRFTNSGTEACMGMLRLARAFTGREKVIKFKGCYHGHADGFLVQVRLIILNFLFSSLLNCLSFSQPQKSMSP